MIRNILAFLGLIVLMTILSAIPYGGIINVGIIFAALWNFANDISK